MHQTEETYVHKPENAKKEILVPIPSVNRVVLKGSAINVGYYGLVFFGEYMNV